MAIQDSYGSNQCPHCKSPYTQLSKDSWVCTNTTCKENRWPTDPRQSQSLLHEEVDENPYRVRIEGDQAA